MSWKCRDIHMCVCTMYLNNKLLLSVLKIFLISNFKLFWSFSNNINESLKVYQKIFSLSYSKANYRQSSYPYLNSPRINNTTFITSDILVLHISLSQFNWVNHFNKVPIAEGSNQAHILFKAVFFLSPVLHSALSAPFQLVLFQHRNFDNRNGVPFPLHLPDDTLYHFVLALDLLLHWITHLHCFLH